MEHDVNEFLAPSRGKVGAGKMARDYFPLSSPRYSTDQPFIKSDKADPVRYKLPACCAKLDGNWSWGIEGGARGNRFIHLLPASTVSSLPNIYPVSF